MYTKYENTIFVIIFKNNHRPPMFIHGVVGIKTGKTLVVEYLARDNRVHRHKYYQKSVFFKELTIEQEIIYREQLADLYKHQQSSSATLPAVSYRGSGVH